MPYADKEKQREYQRLWVANRRTTYIAKFGGCCIQCGSADSLEFDHKDRSEKLDHRVWSWAIPRLEAELAKCQLLCEDCHKKKTKVEISPLARAKRHRLSKAKHGTDTMYRRGCSCPTCVEAHRVANQKYYVPVFKL